MVFIENDGALFRGPCRGIPQEVWSKAKKGWKPYNEAGEIKPVDWGYEISEAEALGMMEAGSDQ
jgi:hypothetical protein